MSMQPMLSRIAVATCERAPDLDDDWPFLRAALGDRGLAVTAAAWTHRAMDWASFDRVVIRGTWDYFQHLEEFRAWVRRVAEVTELLNPAPVVLWNTDKRYLDDLAADGVPVVATTFLTPGRRDTPWLPPDDDFVVKPAVSAGGFETARYRSRDAEAAALHVARLLDSGCTVMVQPYLASVDREGEAALIYLGGRYSHSVNKGPLLMAGAGIEDKLWERERIVVMEPSSAQRDVAGAALAAAAARTGTATFAYARVDLLADADGMPVVSEIELVEPGLFLHLAPGSVARFAEVLATRGW
jgi:O-ureido-D-serine cyclo-ligase